MVTEGKEDLSAKSVYVVTSKGNGKLQRAELARLLGLTGRPRPAGR
jgi:hypothetical protein